MNLQEIKTAVRSGKNVYQHSEIYQVKLFVFKDSEEQWLITSLSNNYSIGLTWKDGVTMNGKEEEFFIN